MTYIRGSLIAAIATVMLAASPLATANPLVPMTDMQASRAIKKANVSLAEAVSYAESSVKGKAIGARFADNADRLVYIVEVVDTNGKVQLVRVTADNGVVTGSWPKAKFQGDSETYPES